METYGGSYVVETDPQHGGNLVLLLLSGLPAAPTSLADVQALALEYEGGLVEKGLYIGPIGVLGYYGYMLHAELVHPVGVGRQTASAVALVLLGAPGELLGVNALISPVVTELQGQRVEVSALRLVSAGRLEGGT